MRVKTVPKCLLPALAIGRFARFGHLSHVVSPAPPFNVEEKCTEAKAGRVRFALPTLSGGAGGRSEIPHLVNCPKLHSECGCTL